MAVVEAEESDLAKIDLLHGGAGIVMVMVVFQLNDPIIMFTKASVILRGATR